jgi:hypothetical protein
MSEVAEIEAHSPRGPYRIGVKLRKALRLLGEGKRLGEAAVLSGMSGRGLTLALRRPQVAEQLTADAPAALVGQLPRETATIERVMTGDNMVAALNSARFVLGAAAGIAEPVRGMQVGVAVNVNVQAGYVLDLRDGPDEPLPRPLVIDAEAT